MADLFPNTRPAGLPTISLWDPWGSLIAAERKPYETRSWAPPARLIGTRIGIHVAKRRVHPDDLDPALETICIEALGDEFARWAPLGCMVCTAALYGAYRCGRAVEGTEQIAVSGVVAGSPRLACDIFLTDALGDYSPGRWAWRLTDVERFEEPIPARGAQGFWTWRQEAQAA